MNDEKFERGPSGMRRAKSKADFVPSPQENLIMNVLFSKYRNDVPPVVVRYLRKMNRKVFTQRLCDIGMIDPEIVLNEFKMK